MPCGLDSCFPPTPEPLKVVPRSELALLGCGTALPLLPPRAAVGPGQGIPHPLAGAEEAPRLAFIPALSGKAPEPALRLAAQESTAAKLSVGSPGVIPGGRLVSNSPCPREIIIHVAPVRAAGSNHSLKGHTGVKPHRKPSEGKASVT